MASAQGQITSSESSAKLPPEMLEVRVCDLVVLGAGIGGVAIAERIAREARRQRKQCRILVLERQEAIGSESSAGLEGWYHTGALYAKPRHERTFLTCAQALVDLVTFYRRDPAFPYRHRCNFDIVASALEAATPKKVEAADRPWFPDDEYLRFALRKELRDPPARLSIDHLLWAQDLEYFQALLRRFFLDRGWAETLPPAGKDIPTQYLRHPDFQAFLESWRKGEITLEGVSDSNHPRVVEDEHTWIESRDSIMDTTQILRDLTATAHLNGVEFLFGQTFLRCQTAQYGDRQLQGVVVIGNEGRPKLICATQYVFALGSGFTQELLHDTLGQRVRVRSRQSTMVVVSPALEIPSFAHVDHYFDLDFNHLNRPFSDDPQRRYSILADSISGVAGAMEGESTVTRTRRILDRARSLGAGENHRIISYNCNKTEFFPDDPTKAGFDFWLEPRLADDYAAGGATGGGSPGSPDVARKLRKAVRDDLCRYIDKGTREAFALSERATTLLKDLEPLAHRYEHICVLPGKFTLFPSLAHEAYLELEYRGWFASLPQLDPIAAEITEAERFARERVSLPRAELLLDETN